MKFISWKVAPLPRDPAYTVIANGTVVGVFGKELSTSTIKGGYLRVPLRDGKKYLVHRLVLEAFVGPCPDGMEASHEDGDPTNNLLDNLLWRTPKSNVGLKRKHGTMEPTYGRRILTHTDVRTIRKRFARGESVSRIAQNFTQVTRAAVSHICHKRNWK